MDDDNELQCPVCLEIPPKEVYQCLNGHTICDKCCASITSCPQCRVDLKVNGELIRNRVVECLIARKTASSSTFALQGPSSTLVVLECPVCHKIPRKGIFQCSNGHSICNLCISKTQICPKCKSDFGRVRNHYAESLLDLMTFPCAWKEFGCSDSFPRTLLNAHESVCKFRPTKFCSTFAGFPKCQFETNISLLNNVDEIKKILQHLGTHNLVITVGVPVGLPFNISVNADDHFALPRNRRVHYLKPRFLEIVNSSDHDNSMPRNNLAILLQRVERRDGETWFSWGLVLFSANNVESDNRFIVRLLIKGQPTPEMVAKDGIMCISDLSFNPDLINDMEYREFLKKMDNEKPPFTFSIPITHLKRNYVDTNGRFTFSISFHGK